MEKKQSIDWNSIILTIAVLLFIGVVIGIAVRGKRQQELIPTQTTYKAININTGHVETITIDSNTTFYYTTDSLPKNLIPVFNPNGGKYISLVVDKQLISVK